MKKANGPEFIRSFHTILSILRESGDVGTPSEIVDRSIELAGVSEQEQQAVNKNGQSRIRNQVHWARQYLVWSGYLDSSRRGIWSLTEKGRTVDISSFDPLHVLKAVQREKTGARQQTDRTEQLSDEPVPDDDELLPHRVRILEIIALFRQTGLKDSAKDFFVYPGFSRCPSRADPVTVGSMASVRLK
jgi:restriction system protein